MNKQQVKCSVESGVATITLDNPPVNVVTLTLSRELGEVLTSLEGDDRVRAVMLRGAGSKAFCAGSDIKEFLDMMEPGQVVPKKLRRQNEIFFQLEQFPKPTVAAIEGLAYGGGMEIALCCDLIVASESSRLCLPEIKLGVFPSSGGTVRATRRVGAGRAKELMFLGEPIDAQLALAWGLVNRVAASGQAYEVARELCATLVRRPRGALALCKSIINMSFDRPIQEVLEESFKASDKAFSSRECAEGVRAFFAKEPANYDNI